MTRVQILPELTYILKLINDNVNPLVQI